MKKLKYILGAGLALLGGKYLFQLHRAGKKVIVSVSGRVHKVTLEGVVVIMNYNIKNPTKGSMEMSTPLIQLTHRGILLASSSMSLVEVPETAKTAGGRIKIQPFRETGAITTSILLPTLSLLGAGTSLLPQLKQRLMSGSNNQAQIPILFEIATTAQLFTKIGSYPYDEKMTLKI